MIAEKGKRRKSNNREGLKSRGVKSERVSSPCGHENPKAKKPKTIQKN
jgi:hypothetical protein